VAGTTRILRAFGPLVRDGGRLIVVASTMGTLHHLAPVLHDRFDAGASLASAVMMRSAAGSSSPRCARE
jgi:hypothetical protein